MGSIGGNRRLGKRSRLYEMLLAPLSTRERIAFVSLLVATVVFFAITSAGASNSMVGSFIYSPFSACDSSGEDGWSSVLQATGLPDANLENSADFSRTAVSRQGSAVLVCGGAEVNQPATVSPGLRLYIALALETPDGATYTEGGTVSEVVISQPKSYIDPGSVEQLLDKFIKLEWSSNDGESWQPLAEISSSDVASGVIDVALPATENPFTEIAIRLTPTSINQDGEWLVVDSIGLTYQVVQPAMLEFEIEGQVSSHNQLVLPAGRDIKAAISLDSPQSGAVQGLARSLPGIADNAPGVEIDGVFIGADGKESAATIQSSWQGTAPSGDLRWNLEVTPPSQLKPGLYTLRTTVSADGQKISASQEVLWGVVAMNTVKSSYQPNEPILFMLSLLDERGATVCDADISLTIKQNGRTVANLTTETGQITVTDTCELYGNQLEADYIAWTQLEASGQYDIELTASNDNISYSTNDTLLVETEPELIINRYGPTRLFPINDYPMEISIEFKKDFDGSVYEYIPSSFKLVSQPDERPYRVEDSDRGKKLTWDISAISGDNIKLKYTFDPPDVSPAFYTLGKLEIIDEQTSFSESRYWQLAGDAVGRMLLFFEGASAPTGWTCVSCSPGDPFYQTFIRANDTYGGTGGATTHNHTANGSVAATTALTLESDTGTTISTGGHSHSFTPTVGSASNLPSYRQLKVIRNNTAGEPATLPAGAIALFDASVPTGWTTYSAQNGYYTRGEDTAGTTGGSNTHTHTITGTTGAASGTTGARTTGPQTSAAAPNHTHTVAGNSGSVNKEPPYIEVIYGQKNSDGPAPDGLLAMWDDEVPSTWARLSGPSGAFYQRFFKGASTYGTTGGGASHSHGNAVITSSGPSATLNRRSGSANASGTHTHQVTVSSFSTDNHLPPYRDVVIGKRVPQSDITLSAFRLYANSNSTDVGNTLASQDTAAPAPRQGVPFRLRLLLHVGNATLAPGNKTFKLQYAERSGTCDTSFIGESYSDVATASGSIRYYDNSAPSDADSLTGNANDPQHSSDTVVDQTYEEANNFTSSNSIAVGEDGLWDFSLVDYSAVSSTSYCFRVVQSNGDLLYSYTTIPEIITDDGNGHMLLMYDGGGVPAGWSCVSCNPGDDLYQRFFRGNSSYGSSGGAASHGHTASASVAATTDLTLEDDIGAEISAGGHGHSFSPTIGTASNLPAYRQLKIIRADTSGVPSSLPTGIIAMFDAAVPSGWTRYAAQDGNYIRAEGTAGTTGGSNTHNHAISGTTTAASATAGARTNGSQVTASQPVHTHSVSGNTGSINHEPPYIETILGKLDSSASVPINIISMWDGPPPGTWSNLSESAGPFYQNFVKPASTYGTTGGGASHSHGNAVITSSGPSATLNRRSGSANASGTHTHQVTVSSFSTDNHLPPYFDVIFAKQTSPNTPPNQPTNLQQVRASDSQVLSVGEWTNGGQVEFLAEASDPDNPDELQLCVEVKDIATSFDNSDTACGTPASYSGTDVNVSVNVSGLIHATGYHWQARTKDSGGGVSAWVSFGANNENEADLSNDSASPSGTVYDGDSTGVDIDYNDGSLDVLSANWDINDPDSGIDYFEYSIGTSPGATDIASWTNIGTDTSVEVSSLNLRTGQVYFYNIRATDQAANPVLVNSDGIFVSPTLQFSVAPSTIVFDNLNVSNNYTDTENSVLTTSTNAYHGYQIQAHILALPTSPNLDVINLFSGGSYASPDEWLGGDTGYGYTSNDTSIQSANIFNSTPCAGGGNPPCFAPFSLTAPGDIVADHTEFISGTPVANQNFVITHRVTVDPTQAPAIYQTQIIYTVTARY